MIVLPLFIDIWYVNFSIKMLKIISISTNIYKIYECGPLSLYISLVNNSIDPKTLYWLTLINYLHQHINLLIKYQFNPIKNLSFQLVGCQPTPHTLCDIEYIRTPTYRTLSSSIIMYVSSFVRTRLINNLGYGQLSNSNCSHNLVPMHGRNH